jgi:uncharacterized protein YjiK
MTKLLKKKIHSHHFGCARCTVMQVLIIIGALSILVGPWRFNKCDFSVTFGLRENIVFPYRCMGVFDLQGFNDPSGICFHSKRRTLFIVGNSGEIGEMTTQGQWIKRKRGEVKWDFEGITHDPATGYLYIVEEGADRIWELNPETLDVIRRFTVPRKLDGQTVMASSGQGLEGITFIPDRRHPEGGTFYVANQSFDLDNGEDISAIFELDVPLRSKRSGVQIRSHSRPGIIDLSGLYYDRHFNCILAISDSTNTVLEYSREHVMVQMLAFPGDDQEGITVDDQRHVYIAQDSGGILKLKWLRDEKGPKLTRDIHLL